MGHLRAVVRRRWGLIAAMLLIVMGAGAVWAATVTPAYRSTSAVDGVPIDIAINSDSELDRSFRAAITGAYGSLFADSVVTNVRRDGVVVELTVEAGSAVVASDLAARYADVITTDVPGSRVLVAASFPSTPSSPNVKRIAATTAVAGLFAGLLEAMLCERLWPARPSTESATKPPGRDDATATLRPDQLVATSWIDAPATVPKKPVDRAAPDSAPQTNQVAAPTLPRIDQASREPASADTATSDRFIPRVVELPPPTKR